MYKYNTMHNCKLPFRQLSVTTMFKTLLATMIGEGEVMNHPES